MSMRAVASLATITAKASCTLFATVAFIPTDFAAATVSLAESVFISYGIETPCKDIAFFASGLR